MTRPPFRRELLVGTGCAWAALASASLKLSPPRNNAGTTLCASACRRPVSSRRSSYHPSAYSALLQALSSDDVAAIDAAAQTKLVDPQAGLAFDLEGADSHHLTMVAAPDSRP